MRSSRETPRAVVLRLDTAGARIAFSAGQAAMVGLADRKDRKPYSIASAPEEQRRSGVIEFLVEVGPDGQSRPNLEGVGPGSRVAVQGPAGGFVLPLRLPRDLLFVAGGTGIAPLRAMIDVGAGAAKSSVHHADLQRADARRVRVQRGVAPAVATGTDSAPQNRHPRCG